MAVGVDVFEGDLPAGLAVGGAKALRLVACSLLALADQQNCAKSPICESTSKLRFAV